jgi:class 3 adenylate cyclase/ABC-type branched-subunit amino acid transport system substrate-binding protein
MSAAARAFLFADLRDYTRYAESHGAAAAATLLERYRALVRTEVARSEGAEIRTEGDSFYVVFPSASSAVLCGLAIVAAADQASVEDPGAPIRVGIGIHAGETVETADGFVGPAVNQAARICSVAAAGEVLVSDTVRVLSEAVLPVVFHARGRQRLKGVPNPVALFAVEPADGSDAWAARTLAADRRRGRRRRIAIGAAALVGVLVLGGIATFALRPPPGLPAGPWVIGLEMVPEDEYFGQLALDGFNLAIDDINAAGGIDGEELVPRIFESALEDEPMIESATVFADDPSVLGMVGSMYSGAARLQIPVTNQAGLLQCSPTATDPELTRPEHGALALRSANPDRINFVRATSTNAVEGLAMASFAYNDLDARHVLVVDSIDDVNAARRIADGFSDAFVRLGGQTTRRTLNEGADPAGVLELLDEDASLEAVWVGSFDPEVVADIRLAMVDAGHGELPMLSWEPIITPTDEESFIHFAGDAADGSYATRVVIAPTKAAFAQRFVDLYDWTTDDVPYAAATYACVEVILDALRAAAQNSPSADSLREAVRSLAVDAESRVETVIGGLTFDHNGDPLQQYVEVMTVDLDADGGIGGWVVTKPTQDYGPLP